MIPRELPPTAGLAPIWRDLVAPPPRAFEEALSQWLGVSEVQIECSATASLYLILEYLKTLSAAREIIIPAYTCPLVPLAAAKAGLYVKVCDVQPDRFDFDIERLQSLVGTRTLCVVPTHWGAALADVAAVREVLDRYASPAFIIEDCAQALGGMVGDHSVGLAGDAAVFSFAAGKGLTLYEGGCIVVGTSTSLRQGLRRTAQRLVGTSAMYELRRSLELLAYHLAYRPRGLYLTYGLPLRHWLARGNVGKALGDEQTAIPLHVLGAWRRRVGANALERLRGHLATARATFKRLQDRLSEIAGVRVQVSAPASLAPCTYMFVTLDTAAAAAWLFDAGSAARLGVSRLFAFALDGYSMLDGCIPRGQCGNASGLAARTVTLTTSSYMTALEEDSVVRLVARAAARIAPSGP